MAPEAPHPDSDVLQRITRIETMMEAHDRRVVEWQSDVKNMYADVRKDVGELKAAYNMGQGAVLAAKFGQAAIAVGGGIVGGIAAFLGFHHGN